MESDIRENSGVGSFLVYLVVFLEDAFVLVWGYYIFFFGVF